MDKKYTAATASRTPRPRSKRQREQGIGSAQSVVVLGTEGITDSYLPIAVFSDLFEKVLITPPVIDDDGNVTTPARYAIQANYDLYSIGGISAYGFSGTGSGGGTASVDVTAILKEGVHIATINGVDIYAPEGGSGASSWAELTGRPEWLTDEKPNVSFFENNAGYITDVALSAALSDYATTAEVDHKDELVLTSVAQSYVSLNAFNSYKGVVTSDIESSAQGVKDWVAEGYVTKEDFNAQKITGYGKSLDTNDKYLRLISESGSVLSSVIAPYAAYTDQLGATGSTAVVSIYGEVKMENGSLAVAGNVNANYNISAGGNLSAAGSLSVTGESRFSGAVYLPGQFTFFGQSGIYVEADRTTKPYGTVAYIGVHRSFSGVGTIAAVNLDGRVRIWQPMGINQDPEDGISLRVGGTLKTDLLTAGGMTRPEGYWFASPNGYFGNPTSGTYTSFGDGGIELSQATPYIDFHYGCSTADYTSRLIATEDGVLMIDSATADPALRIGNAYLRYDTTNNALYVTGRDGAQVNLYATGGLAAYSAIGSVTQLANLQLTGQLRARSAAFTGMVQASSILLDNFTLDTNNEYFEIRYNGLDYAENQLVLDVYGDIYSEGYLYVNGKTWLNETYIGSQASTYKITSIYADGINVYITINGKKYKLANA